MHLLFERSWDENRYVCTIKSQYIELGQPKSIASVKNASNKIAFLCISLELWMCFCSMLTLSYQNHNVKFSLRPIELNFCSAFTAHESFTLMLNVANITNKLCFYNSLHAKCIKSPRGTNESYIINITWSNICVNECNVNSWIARDDISLISTQRNYRCTSSQQF